jgi:hypothetical protein
MSRKQRKQRVSSSERAAQHLISQVKADLDTRDRILVKQKGKPAITQIITHHYLGGRVRTESGDTWTARRANEGRVGYVAVCSGK